MNWSTILVVITIIYAVGAPEAKAWMLPENTICCDKQINNGPFNFIAEVGQKISELKNEIKWSIEGWTLEEICEISCQFLLCLFTSKPTEDEICQQLRYRNHACCQRHTNAGSETTAQLKTPVEISPKDNLTSPTEQLSTSPPPSSDNFNKPAKQTKTGFMPDG